MGQRAEIPSQKRKKMPEVQILNPDREQITGIKIQRKRKVPDLYFQEK
ncbi:hypothetical protein [Eisenbergiella massiliensis]|nr:hypothetical protein [Eisenbergiella massiliensis]